MEGNSSVPSMQLTRGNGLMAKFSMAGLLDMLAVELGDVIGWLGHQGQAGRVIPQVRSGCLHPPSAVPTVTNLGTPPCRGSDFHLCLKCSAKKFC